MNVDDIAALRLYSESKASAPLMKELTSYEEESVEIAGVPSIVRFGFFSKKDRSGAVTTTACAWIFGGSGVDFFGSHYSPVYEDSSAPSVLNWTICYAIETAKLNPKFHSIQGLRVGKS